MEPYWSNEQHGLSIYHGDCIDVLAALPDSSVNLLCTDPPYYRVKALPWDRQWEKPEEFIAWIGRLCAEWQRVLAPNGSLYVFASPKMAARVECEVGRWFEVLNHIVWPKADDYSHALRYGDDRFRKFVQKSERIIFAEHFGADNRAKGEAGYGAACDELRGFVFEPLRAYLDGERRRAGFAKPQIDAAWCALKCVGQTAQSQKWFSPSCWGLPTAEAYRWLRDLFNRNGGEFLAREYEDLRREYEDLRREYEDLRREYEDLRREYEDLRRPFSVTVDVPCTDVWDFPTVKPYPGKHPCEKPLAMMEHIVRASSREGDTVLDCFMGSGVTGEAAIRNGRRFIGMEMAAEWCELAATRLEREIAQGRLFEPAETAPKPVQATLEVDA